MADEEGELVLGRHAVELRSGHLGAHLLEERPRAAKLELGREALLEAFVHDGEGARGDRHGGARDRDVGPRLAEVEVGLDGVADDRELDGLPVLLARELARVRRLELAADAAPEVHLVAQVREAGERLEGLSGQGSSRGRSGGGRCPVRELGELHVGVGARHADLGKERRELLADDAPGDHDARERRVEVLVLVERLVDEPDEILVVEDLPVAARVRGSGRDLDRARGGSRDLGHALGDRDLRALVVGPDGRAASEDENRGDDENGGDDGKGGRKDEGL